MTGSPMRTGRRSATSFLRWSNASRSLLIAFGSSSGLNRARQRHPNRAEICHIVQHVVIVDNLPVHRAYRVTAWVQNHADQIELFYLPSYAPEHNPDEFLNNDLKQAMARRRTPRDKAALKSSLTS